jgi:tetratricopeptide (TPR) repeat protein
LLVLALLPWAAAQQGNNSSSSGTSSSTDTTASRTTTTAPPPTIGRPLGTTPDPQQSRQQQQQRQELIFVSGMVVTEDGTPPPFGTVVERDCGVSVITEAVVGTNGQYSFQVGGTDRFGRIFADASEGIGQDPFDRDMANLSTGGLVDSYAIAPMPLSVKLLSCQLRAKLAGYQSSSVRFDEGRSTGLIEMRTIVIYPYTRARGTLVSATNLLAPKGAKKALEQARKAQKKKETGPAEKSLESAVEIYPKYAEAWFELGRLFQGQKRSEEARSAYKKAIDADKLYIGPYIGLAQLAAEEKRWSEVADNTDQALALDPLAFPVGYFLNSLAYYNLGKMDPAEKSARQGLRMGLEKETPRIHLVLANILAKKNDRTGSAEEMRKYLRIAPNSSDADAVRALVQESERATKAAAIPR